MEGPFSERVTIPELVDAITTTLAHARAEGEPYKKEAEALLGPIETILQRIALERHDIDIALQHERTILEHLEEQAEAGLHAHADKVWEHLGCPDYDPIYTVLFPSRSPEPHAFEAHAERLSLVADLLSSGIHPKIDRICGSRVAQEIRMMAEEFRAHLLILSKYQTRQTSLNALEASVARIGLLELGTLRRTLRTLGLDDTRIKYVVPAPVSSRRIPMKSGL